jgi:CheY-like chemotaxis protein
MKQGGTGLGLAIARSHVEIMGGELILDEAPARGAKFHFTLHLPALGTPSGRTVVEAIEDKWSSVSRLGPGESVRALVVDDVATNRDILERMLQRIGVTVDSAESGERALEMVRINRPDIVFMDIRMPGGLDGTETMLKLLEEHGQDAMKIVAVTASVFQHQRDKFLEEGFDGFIDKPLRAEQLYSALAEEVGVSFEFLAPDLREQTRVRSGNWEDVELPSDLYEKLMSAVDTHNITELRKLLDAVITLGEQEGELGAHLLELAQRFDVEKIEETLSGIKSS